MQQPKQSLDDAIASHYSAMAQAIDKTAQEPSKEDTNPQTPGQAKQGFVTRNSPAQREAGARDDMFARGLREGMAPLAYDRLHISHPINNDTTTYSIGGVSVHVSALEQLQATDPEDLGWRAGRELYRLFALANPAVPGRRPAQAEDDPKVGCGVPAGHFDGEPNAPLGQRPYWNPQRTALQDRLESVRYMGQPVVFDGPKPEGPMLQMTVSTQFLSEVLHELAGMASMCWTQPPKGVFDSTRCLDAVAHALKRLAPDKTG